MRAITILAFMLALLLPAPRALAAESGQVHKAQALLQAVEKDLLTGGLQALQPRVGEIERTLEAVKDTPIEVSGDTITVPVDGQMEILFAITAARKFHPNKQAAIVDNPYPRLALYLASYYNEVHRPKDAIRILTVSPRLFAAPDLRAGSTLPDLMSELAIAHADLKDFTKSLAIYDDALTIETMPDSNRARLHRGRGFALIELGLLDEAEAAYRKSLELAPGNKVALNELNYIASLRKGRTKAPTMIILSPPDTANPAADLKK